jgi:hypothetical protein
MDRQEFEQEILKIRSAMLPDSMKERLERELRANFEMMQQAGATRDPETGLFRGLDGRLYETIEEVDRSNEELRRRQELEKTEEKTERELGELESLIRRSGAAQRQMAERVGARQTGQLMGQLERSILGAGGDIQALEALTPAYRYRSANCTTTTASTKTWFTASYYYGSVRSNTTADTRSNGKSYNVTRNC